MTTCIVIPTYNNASTLVEVIGRTLRVHPNVIVVNDGSTDATHDLLAGISDIEVVEHDRNRGKGRALLSGFARARQLGFDNVISIDADAQHYPEDIPLLLEAAEKHPGAIIIGSRNLQHQSMKGGSKFANKFSNLWFTIQTGVNLPDTQTGYRLYPLRSLHGLDWITSRYESELELLVFAAWHDVKILPVGIRVYYPDPEERVTHFRPIYDFSRISVLNTVLCLLAVLYGYPCKFITRIVKKLRGK